MIEPNYYNQSSWSHNLTVTVTVTVTFRATVRIKVRVTLTIKVTVKVTVTVKGTLMDENITVTLQNKKERQTVTKIN